MHGLDDGILVVQGNVVGAEIPVIPDAQRVKLVDGAFHRGTGDAENRHNRFFIGAERFERIGRQNGQTGKLLADHGFAAVEDADQLKARKIVCDVGRDRPAQIAGAEQNAFVRAVQTENIADFLAQLPHGVAVALLAIAAEAVEVLADLRSCQAQLFRELSGGYAQDAAPVQVLQKTVVAGKTADHGHGNIRFLLHNNQPFPFKKQIKNYYCIC